jgi:hypothetical protein
MIFNHPKESVIMSNNRTHSSTPTLKLPEGIISDPRFGNQPNRSERSMRGTIDLKTHSNPLHRYYLVLTSQSNLSLHRMSLFQIHNPRAASNARRYQAAYLAYSFDSRDYVSGQGNRESINYDDSNFQMMRLVYPQKDIQSSYNGVTATCGIDLALVPLSDTTWDNIEDNRHAVTAYQQFKALLAQKAATSEQQKTAIMQIWNAYKAAEERLIADNKIGLSNILVANPSGIRPMIFVCQGTESPNLDMNAELIVSNAKSEATFMPVVNSFTGDIMCNLEQTHDSLTNATFGYQAIQQRQANRQPNAGGNMIDEQSGIVSDNTGETIGSKNRFTAMCTAYTFLNTPTTERGVIISMEDAPRTPRGQVMENFFKNYHGYVIIMDAKLSLLFHNDTNGARTLASTFVFGGQFNYKAHQDPKNPDAIVQAHVVVEDGSKVKVDKTQAEKLFAGDDMDELFATAPFVSADQSELVVEQPITPVEPVVQTDVDTDSLA